MLTLAKLIAAGASPAAARQFVEPLAAACALHDIATRLRLAAFLAQVLHESDGLTRTEENLHYRTAERIRAVWPTRVPTRAHAQRLAGQPQALANAVYSGRNGNGDAASGDGWTYRGRGLLQITGRANYAAAAAGTARPYVARPELVALPSDAALTAAHFWTAHRLNEAADRAALDAITLAVNGPARAGAGHRRELYRRALAALAA